MTEFWEAAFVDKQLMWGLEPSRSAVWASERFAAAGLHEILIPGVGYGRNAKPFLAAGMAVTGIEISETAIALARTQLGLGFPIHHGSVTAMPYDENCYDGVFCYGMLYLLDAAQRTKVIRDCHAQLRPGGQMVFTLIAKSAPMYGQGERLGDDWYEIMPGVKMYFYDASSAAAEFASYGLVEVSAMNELSHGGSGFPFLNVVCRRA